MSGSPAERGNGLSDISAALPSTGTSLFAAMGAAMLGVLWAYEGWHFITFSAGEVVEPQKNFARGIIIGTATLIGIYLLANVAYVAALGVQRSATSERIAAEAVAQILGPGAGKLIALAILVSMFSAANAVVLTASRVYFAMAQDGLFFERMGCDPSTLENTRVRDHCELRVGSDPRIERDVRAALDLCRIHWLGVLRARRGIHLLLSAQRSRMLPGPFACRVYPWTPLVFISRHAAIVLNTLFLHPGQAAVGIGLVLLGVPVYWFWRAKEREARAS